MEVLDICSSKFKTYGNIVSIEYHAIEKFVNDNILHNIKDCPYTPSIKTLEEFSVIGELKRSIYGELDIIAGIVQGHNMVLNGIEYHQGSETIIALTDYYLVVGHRWDIKENHYDTNNVEVFFVPKGTTIELFSTTLHYTPIQAHESGFLTICLLLKGTGNQLCDGRQGILKKCNKWFIAHKDNVEKIKDGDYPGLDGKMLKRGMHF